jgi:hypothetical protein
MLDSMTLPERQVMLELVNARKVTVVLLGFFTQNNGVNLRP